MKLDQRILNLQENVKGLSDKVLLEQTSYIAEHERGVTILALRHLREVEVRRLFIELKCASMYAYCIKHLKYSENKTISRLASARLMTELPEIEEQIQVGSLNITNLSKIHSFVRAEKGVQNSLTKVDKLALIADCENKPTREVAKELIKKSHQPALLAEKFQMTAIVLKDESLNLEYSKFDALLDPEDKDLLQEFKNLYAHDLQDGANITVLKFLLKKAVQHKKKQLGIEPKNNAPVPLSPKVTSEKVATAIAPTKLSAEKSKSAKPAPQRKPLPVAVKRFVWKRAGACCEHMDSKIGMKCESKFALQPDHIIPVALGGTDEVDNLQLLCRAHNSRRAIKTFGIRRI
jgi:hypothetical protein